MTPSSGVQLHDVLSAIALVVDLGLGRSVAHLARSCQLAQRLGIECGVPIDDLEPLYYLAMLGGLADDAAPGVAIERFGRGLGLAESACRALGQLPAGHGLATHPSPGSTDVEVSVRLWQIADVAETWHSRGGPEAASSAVAARCGTALDPGLADRFRPLARTLLADLPADADQAWQAVRAALPRVDWPLEENELDAALEAVADLVDQRSAWSDGHSRAVAALAFEAARLLRQDEADARLVWRAALLHDVGRLGVPQAVWDRPGLLDAADWEHIRLHSYLTERSLARPAALGRIGVVAAMAHERLDGSGYHRGLSAAELPTPARILAAADRFQTSLEDRPHRPAVTSAAAAAALWRDADAGALDGDAVEAVLAASGVPNTRRHAHGPAGLTRRETQILVLLARGNTNRQIGRSLGVAQKTVGNHIQHIYAKAGVGTRAAAARFALERGLA